MNGNTITFSTPVHITYTTAKAAQLVRYTGADSIHVRDAGVEDMTLTGGSDGNLSFSSAAYSWAKNIECTQYGNPCVDITHSFRLEIRDSYHSPRDPPVSRAAAATRSACNKARRRC